MSDENKAMKQNPFDREFPHARYHRDPAFHALVDVLYVHIQAGNYTPTELREACHLAACMYEERTIRPMFIDPSEPLWLAILIIGILVATLLLSVLP